MKKYIIFLVMLSLLLHLSCLSNPPETAGDSKPQYVPRIIEKDINVINKMEQSPFYVQKMEWINGEIVKLMVQYSGGCGEHDFILFWDGVIKQTTPSEARGILIHTSNDPCGKEIIEELYINLKEWKDTGIIRIVTEYGAEIRLDKSEYKSQ